MRRLRAFYLNVRIELAFVIILYVWIRLARYEFHPATEHTVNCVFDRWTTRVDNTRLTRDRFVADPGYREIK